MLTAMGRRAARLRPTWIVPPLRFPVFSNVRSLPEGVSNVVKQLSKMLQFVPRFSDRPAGVSDQFVERLSRHLVGVSE